jgi:hydrogenase nickel incorporation protein HypA/HybF
VHELSLCQGILDSIEAAADEQPFRKVHRVELEIGALAGVDAEALRFGWEAISPGTRAEGARLEIVDLPGSAWCFQCQRNVEITQYYDPCPHCQSHRLQVNSGEQLKIKQLEVE